MLFGNPLIFKIFASNDKYEHNKLNYFQCLIKPPKFLPKKYPSITFIHMDKGNVTVAMHKKFYI